MTAVTFLQIQYITSSSSSDFAKLCAKTEVGELCFIRIRGLENDIEVVCLPFRRKYHSIFPFTL